jgi:hypothetical protein
MNDLFDYVGEDLPGDGYSVYKHLRDSPYCEEDRQYLRSRWTQFQALGLDDPGFLARFAAECPARIWEMRLACILASWGLRLVPSRKPGEGPDFGLTMDDGRIMWVEATAPTPGAEGSRDRVRAPLGQPIPGGELERTTSLRYLSAINDKRNQHRRAREAGLIQADDGYVVAISGSQIPLADLDPEHEPPRIAKALFGIGAATFAVELGTGRITRGRPAQRVSFRKSSGTEISASLFLTPDSGEISAVLFDPHHVKNRPEVRGKEVGRDLVVVHNPFAHVPFPMGALGSGREFFVALTMDDRRTKRSLVHRLAAKIRNTGAGLRKRMFRSRRAL